MTTHHVLDKPRIQNSDKAGIRAVRKAGVELQSKLVRDLAHVDEAIRRPLLRTAERRINRGDSLAALSFLIASDSAQHATVLTDLGRFVAAVEAALGIAPDQSTYTDLRWRVPLIEVDLIDTQDLDPDLYRTVKTDRPQWMPPQSQGMWLHGQFERYVAHLTAQNVSHPMVQNFLPLLMDAVTFQSLHQSQTGHEVHCQQDSSGDEWLIYVQTPDPTHQVRFRINTQMFVHVIRKYMDWEDVEITLPEETR